jgi:hypothetical protein
MTLPSYTPPPTLAGFTIFVQTKMGISVTYVPANSQDLVDAYAYAIEVVYPGINFAFPNLFTLAVYNLAGDYLINWASDQPGQTFFKLLREQMGINTFVAGVISGSADESTSESIEVPEAMRRIMLSDVQALKTPYGRQYLAIAQRIGPLWGMS